jgi:hypothetical protein
VYWNLSRVDAVYSYSSVDMIELSLKTSDNRIIRIEKNIMNRERTYKNYFSTNEFVPIEKFTTHKTRQNRHFIFSIVNLQSFQFRKQSFGSALS